MMADTAAIQQRMAALQHAEIHETHLYTPQATVAGAAKRPLPFRQIAADSVLGEALAATRRWSEAQQGVALLVLIDGQVVDEHYGADVGRDIPLNSFSMHKSVLALAVLAACDDGIIASLDTPAGDYLDDWRNDARGTITIRQLLHMASGLELIPFTSGDPRALEMIFGTQIDAVTQQSALVETPGSSFVYNNANSQIVGQILSVALARAGCGSYVDYLSRRLWAALSNHDATLWLDRPGGAPHYAMNLHATARDWARIGELVRNHGRVGDIALVSEQAIATLASPSVANPAYGLHIWRSAEWSEHRNYSPGGTMTAYHSAPFLADDLIYFDGFGGQRVYVVPSCKLTIVRLGAPNLQFDDAIIPNRLIAALRWQNSSAEQPPYGTIIATRLA